MTRYGKTMMEALSEVREGYSPKQVKMAIGIASDKRYAGGNMSGAVAAIEKIKKGLSDHKQVAAVLKRQNEEMCSCDCGQSPCESCGENHHETMDESSKAKRDAMRAMGKRGVDPADVDEPKASAADQASAGKNMVTQLRKAMDTRGNFSLEFQDGKKQKVDSKVVDTLLKAYDMIRKPRDKEKFVAMISKSYRDMLNTTKMVSKQLRMGEEVILEGFEIEESKSSTGYDLYHKTFSGAMQHAYAFAKKKFGMEIDPDEIDSKVAMGPKKPSSGKTNTYRLKAKGSKKGIQVQVANLDNKRYELNMYKEEVEGEITDALVEGMKMNDPKLLRVFDKLKKGSTVKIKHDSTLEKGKDFIEYIVKSKNMVNKGRVEKITMARKDSPTSAKRYLYKRDEKVTMAFGDMAVSPVDIKEGVEPIQWPSQPLPEDFTPHMMYDPKTGKGYKAEKEADHLRMKDMGYTHEKPDLDENKSLIKDYEKYMSQSGKKSHNAFDYLMSMPKYKRMSKDQMAKIIGDAKRKGIFKEEEEPQKPDSAKEVEQGRDDKKKTRIAQLQLQIAKAQETINKMNAQEK